MNQETEKSNASERNLGTQPIAQILIDRGWKPHDVVAASEVPMTHKLVQRALKGRRLTRHSAEIVRNAMTRLTGEPQTLQGLFNYEF